jgi:uncharacterized protein YndB with AHSA1/START domain
MFFGTVGAAEGAAAILVTCLRPVGGASACLCHRRDRGYTARMETQHYSMEIDAPVERVWETMLDDATYRQWTSVFSPGSYFEGSWMTGSEIRFLGSAEEGEPGGMVGVIRENRPHEFVSIEYRGQIIDGVEDTESDDARSFIGTHENYSFAEADGVTTVSVDIDVDEKWADDFAEEWPRALAKVKELAEAEATERGER